MAKERWSSKLGIIMAVAGSAIGLGNFLRFPVQAAKHGGGAFLIPYFIALLLLGIPLMWIEWTIGRFGGGFGHSTSPGIFQTLWNKNRFIKYFGVIGIFAPLVIFIYYVYIESWLLGYSFFALTGLYNSCTTEEAMTLFLRGYQGLARNNFFSSLRPAYFFFLVTFALNLLILYQGVQRGIERVCKYAMPVLFFLGIILLVRVFTLGTPNPQFPENSIYNGLGFLWNPDWSALRSGRVWLAAAGQIFFTLSCGIGIILTYASYLRREDDVVLSGLSAVATNEVAEVILGGSIVIPAAFAFFGPAGLARIAQGGSFNLGFVTMPLVLQRLGFGQAFGFIWFGLLFLAGITSSISLAQPAIAFLEDEFNLGRRRTLALFAAVTFLLTNAVIFFMGRGVLDEMDFWGGTFCLVLFATIETILFAWVFGIDRAWTEMHAGSDITLPRFYRFIIKYVTPAFLLAILGFWLVQEGMPVIRLHGVPAGNVPYVTATRVLLLLIFAGLAWLVKKSWDRRLKAGAAGSPEEEGRRI
ncbi:MAG TPA: sodium-dependent transporter [bacterium]|nr:sodium-dependent transporter [bacterium]HNS48162.1 sodium-dependent transporter [bacterium]